MADAYGGISLSTSHDVEIDTAFLVEILNAYSLNKGKSEWITFEINGEDACWHPFDFNTQYPSVFSEESVATILKDLDDFMKRILHDVATDEDLYYYWDIEEEKFLLRL